MESKKSLNIVMWISVLGMFFSGYLSLTELTAQTCTMGGCQTLLGIPTCMYGFVTYMVIFILCLMGRRD